MSNRFREYYAANPTMVSSPFGGIDGIQEGLFGAVLDELGIDVADRHILDVGCGRGYAGELVRSRGGDYTGADLVVSRPGLPMTLADACHLPFPDASFDGVFCVDAFEHVPGQGRAAREFRRVLRPGGFVFLSVPNYGNVAGLVKKYCEARGSYEKDTWAPFQSWKPQELEQFMTGGRARRVFREAGFAKARKIGYGPEVDAGLFPWIALADFPERFKYRLQNLFRILGGPLVRIWPGASLHLFWKFEV